MSLCRLFKDLWILDKQNIVYDLERVYLKSKNDQKSERFHLKLH